MPYQNATTIHKEMFMKFPPDGYYGLQVNGETVSFTCDGSTQVTDVPLAGTFTVTDTDGFVSIKVKCNANVDGEQTFVLDIDPVYAKSLACLFYLIATHIESVAKIKPPF